MLTFPSMPACVSECKEMQQAVAWQDCSQHKRMTAVPTAAAGAPVTGAKKAVVQPWTCHKVTQHRCYQQQSTTTPLTNPKRTSFTKLSTAALTSASKAFQPA